MTKDIAADARVRLEMRREFFNTLVEHGRHRRLARRLRARPRQGHRRDQYMRLIVNVVERQEERARTRKARH